MFKKDKIKQTYTKPTTTIFSTCSIQCHTCRKYFNVWEMNFSKQCWFCNACYGVVMFEKESKEYARKNTSYYGTDDCYDTDTQKVEQVFKDAAEFGYNFAKEEIDYLNKHWRSEEERNAAEWHYVENGDLPKDEEWKWCVSYRGYCYVAKYEEMFGCWTNQEYSEVMQPYAWKEIVLPKLPKESK